MTWSTKGFTQGQGDHPIMFCWTLTSISMMPVLFGLEPRDFDGWPRPFPSAELGRTRGAKVGCARKVVGDDRGASQDSIGRSGLSDPCAVSAVCCRGRGDLFKSLGLQWIFGTQRSQLSRLEFLRRASSQDLLWEKSHQTSQKSLCRLLTWEVRKMCPDGSLGVLLNMRWWCWDWHEGAGQSSAWVVMTITFACLFFFYMAWISHDFYCPCITMIVWLYNMYLFLIFTLAWKDDWPWPQLFGWMSST